MQIPMKTVFFTIFALMLAAPMTLAAESGSFVLNLHPGWNHVSTPLGHAQYQSGCQFPANTPRAWHFNGTEYESAALLEPGKGYWIYYGQATGCNAQFTGDSSASDFSSGPVLLAYNNLKEYSPLIRKNTVTADLGFEFDSGIVSQIHAQKGGQYYAGQQSVYPAYNAEVVMDTKGQALGYWAYLKTLGAGNALYGNGVIESWGGEGNVGAASIPEAGVGEFDVFQGSGTDGKNIFTARIQSINSNTLTYSDANNEDALGARFLLNRNRAFTSSPTVKVILARGNNVAFSGIDWTRAPINPVGMYIKIGSSDDLYGGNAQGDDVPFDSKNVGHWYRVTSILPGGWQGLPSYNPGNTLTIDQTYDYQNLADGTYYGHSGEFVLMSGALIQTTDKTSRTLKLDNTYPSWQPGDLIYSPPNHLQSMIGLNFYFHKRFKTGGLSVQSNGINLANIGTAPMDNALKITGNWNTNAAGFRNGIVFRYFNGETGIDFSGANFSSAIKMGPNSAINWTSGESLYANGNGIRIPGTLRADKICLGNDCRTSWTAAAAPEPRNALNPDTSTALFSDADRQPESPRCQFAQKNGFKTVTATCPAGTSLQTGGCQSEPDAALYENGPTGLDTWQCRASSGTVTAKTICCRTP